MLDLVRRIQISLLHNLVLLSLKDSEKRAIDIARFLREKVGIEVGSGALFPILYRLMGEGYIERRNNHYRLTEKGKKELNEFKHLLEKITSLL